MSQADEGREHRERVLSTCVGMFIDRINVDLDETKKPKCNRLAISPELQCTPEMIALCLQEDGVRCDGHGKEDK